MAVAIRIWWSRFAYGGLDFAKIVEYEVLKVQQCELLYTVSLREVLK